MIVKSILRFLYYSSKVLISLQPRTFEVLRLIFEFTLSHNLIGSKISKLRLRYEDLSILRKLGLIRGKIVDFGSGSSTIFFLNCPRVNHLVTFEEDARFLLPGLKRVSSKKLDLRFSKAVQGEIWGVPGTRYQEQLLGSYDFIYIDGPTCNSNESGLSLPNLDLILEYNGDLLDTAIAIDSRTSTTLFLGKHLHESHFLIPSTGLSGKLTAIANQFSKSYGLELLEDLQISEGINLRRTNLLIPKNRKELFT